MHYLIRFLEKRHVNAKIFDVSFYHEDQSILHFLKSILTFPSKIVKSSLTVIRLPSAPNIGQNRNTAVPLMHFIYSFFIIFFARFVRKSIDFNVIVAADPFSAFVAHSIKKSNTFVVYEDLDCFADLYSGIRRKLISFLEKFALKRANLVISVSQPLLRRASQLNSNCLLISNGANLVSFHGFQAESREPFIVYTGSFDKWAGLELVIRAFPLVKRKVPNVKMKIIGGGEETQALETLVKNLSLRDSIFFTGKLPYDQMAEVLCKCYVGVAMFRPCDAATFASPLKLFDYMAAGLPVIATKIGDIERIVKESNSGIVVEWDIADFARATAELFERKNLWLTFHQNALQYIKKYGWDNLFDRWLKEINVRYNSK